MFEVLKYLSDWRFWASVVIVVIVVYLALKYGEGKPFDF